MAMNRRDFLRMSAAFTAAAKCDHCGGGGTR